MNLIKVIFGHFENSSKLVSQRLKIFFTPKIFQVYQNGDPFTFIFSIQIFI